MFLSKIEIKNFRCLKELSLTFVDFTLLIGENNTGKSSVLEAIKLCLNKTISSKFGIYDFYMDENHQLLDCNSEIDISLFFEEKKENEWNGYISDIFYNVIQFKQTSPLRFLIFNTKVNYDEELNDFTVNNSFLNPDKEMIERIPQSLVNRFTNYLYFCYISAVRDVNETFSQRSIVWGRFLKKANIPQDDFQNLSENIKNLNSEIINKDEKLKTLLNELNEIQRIVSIGDRTSIGRDEQNLQCKDIVSINAIPLKPWDLLSRAQVVLKNTSSSAEIPIVRQGQGTQSVSSILLFKAFLNSFFNSSLTIGNNSAGEAILGLEEPEAHLHPQAVKALFNEVNSINCQKIITSHSPFFIENSDLRSLRLLRKTPNGTVVHKINESYSFEIDASCFSDKLSNFCEYHNDCIQCYENEQSQKIIFIVKNIEDKKYILDLEKRLTSTKINGNYIREVIRNIYLLFSHDEILNLERFVRNNRSDILFADRWLLFEGESEELIFPSIANSLGIDFDSNSISCFAFRHADVKCFAKLAIVLGIRFIVYSDNDKQGDNTEKELRKLSHILGNNSDYLVKTVEVDLESELLSSDRICSDCFLICSGITNKESIIKPTNSSYSNNEVGSNNESVYKKRQDINKFPLSSNPIVGLLPTEQLSNVENKNSDNNSLPIINNSSNLFSENHIENNHRIKEHNFSFHSDESSSNNKDSLLEYMKNHKVSFAQRLVEYWRANPIENKDIPESFKNALQRLMI